MALGTQRVRKQSQPNGGAGVNTPVENSGVLWIKRLLWLYFILWLFEGSLRKWVVPGASDALVIIRDPIVLLIYGIAVVNRLFPSNGFFAGTFVLAALSILTSLLVAADTPLMILFGVRTDFLFLPLIFLVPRIWNLDDVRKIGRVTLTLALPMALLMAAQFVSPSGSWLNAGAGEGGGQLGTHTEHVRPAGTFSFTLGPTLFFPLITAFLLDGLFGRGRQPVWLLWSAAGAVILGCVVSGSRALVLGVVGVVVIATVAAMVFRPQLFFRLIQAYLVVGLAAGLASQFSVFGEGVQILTNRFMSNEDDIQTGLNQGILMRVLGGMTGILDLWSEAPVLGFGLGAGTLIGSKLRTGQMGYLSLGEAWSEGEWARVVLECGPVLGMGFLLLRTILCVWLFGISVVQARRGNVLPILLFGAVAQDILLGGWGQSTMLGYTVLVAGLTLAAAEPSTSNETKQSLAWSNGVARNLPGRMGRGARNQWRATS